MREKVILIDVETTGLSPYSHSIHQLSGYICEESETAIDVIRTFNSNILPFRIENADPKALEVSGLTIDVVEAYENPKEIHKQFTLMMENFVNKFDKKDKFHFLAYNAPFDSQFLRKWFEDCGDKYYGSWFYTPAIDVMTLAGSYLMDARREMVNFKLSTVANAMGIMVEESRLHDSMYDIELTLLIYAHIRNKQIRKHL